MSECGLHSPPHTLTVSVAGGRVRVEVGYPSGKRYWLSLPAEHAAAAAGELASAAVRAAKTAPGEENGGAVAPCPPD